LPGHFDRRHRLLEDVLRDERVPEEVSRVWLRIDETLRPSVLLAAQGARSASRQPT
jgi:hypothetical protein